MRAPLSSRSCVRRRLRLPLDHDDACRRCRRRPGTADPETGAAGGWSQRSAWRLREKVRGNWHDSTSRGYERRDAAHGPAAPAEGGVGAQVWSVYVPAELPAADAVLAVIEQIDLVHRMVQRYPETLALVRSADEIEQQHRQGRIACLVGRRGGHAIGNSLAVLRQLYALGVRAMTLTHSLDTGWADACSDEPRHAGLNAFGVEVVHEMNRVGILVDLAHVSHATMQDALDASLAPVIFSHSSPTRSCRTYAMCRRRVAAIAREWRHRHGHVRAPVRVPGSHGHDAEEKAEAARLEVHFPGQKAMVREHLEAWRAEHPRHARRCNRWRTTSRTSFEWQASITSDWAPTSTA